MSQESRNYYDDQFNDRINQIAKPGATPPRSAGSGSAGGGGWGLKGGLGGGAVLAFIVIRLVLAAGRLGSSSTPTYSPPPVYQPPVTFPEHRFDPGPGARPGGEDRLNDEDNARLMELLRQLQEPHDPEAGPNRPPLDVPREKVPPAAEKK
jgi:hypothetical protein